MDLKLINGNEIIEFLNNSLKDDTDGDFEDAADVEGFKFLSQGFKDRNGLNTYYLKFSTYWNNWGTSVELKHNSIYINFDDQMPLPLSIYVSLEEPLDGDGTPETVANLLKKWLPTHIFKQNSEELYNSIISEVSEKIKNSKYGSDTTKINELIELLTKARTYLK